ncbi:MAG: sensor histidine kinase [Bacillota bacterium]
MFRNLKLKLTLIYVMVVVIITLFFMAGIHMMMVRGMKAQSDEIMRLVAHNAGLNAGNQAALQDSRWFNYFYVITGQSGSIVETSPNLPMSRDRLETLVGKALENGGDKGRVKTSRRADDYYLFLKAAPEKGSGQVLVFLDPEPQNFIFKRLVRAFAVTSLGGIVLTFFGSYFMAGRALVPIKKSWERQKKFVADASHELRTPLAVIQTNLDIVRGSPGETVASQEKWLENIDTESKLMAKLVDDLLFLARADSQQELVSKGHFPLAPALDEVVKAFEPLAARRGIKLNYQAGPDISLYADRTRIKQLVSILLDNGLKYTPGGGEVTLEVKNPGHGAEIIVSDTGEGIAKEHQDKIFERFYRVDKARSREDGGTGLGLAIAESIVKAHNGTIKVRSSAGEGSTFIITLPGKN